MQKKQLDDVTTWLTNNCIAQCPLFQRNQTMKLGQLIGYNKRNIFLQKWCRKWGRETNSRPLYFWKIAWYEVKASGMLLSFNIFRKPSTWDIIKTNCIKLQTIGPEIHPVLIFQKRVWNQFLHHILCIIFQENCFSCYILLTGWISLSG